MKRLFLLSLTLLSFASFAQDYSCNGVEAEALQVMNNESTADLASVQAESDPCIKTIVKSRIMLNDQSPLEEILEKHDSDLYKIANLYYTDVLVYYPKQGIKTRMELSEGFQEILSDYASCQLTLLE